MAACVPANADSLEPRSPDDPRGLRDRGPAGSTAHRPPHVDHDSEPLDGSLARHPSPLRSPTPPPDDLTTSHGTTPETQPEVRPGSAVTTLATLAIKGRAPKTGYDRDRFGQAWADVDRNGCDTRNDILRRDLTACTIKAGTHGCWCSPARSTTPTPAQTIAFVRG